MTWDIRFHRWFAFALCLLLAPGSALRAATVTGTIYAADGSLFTGTMLFRTLRTPLVSGSTLVTGGDYRVSVTNGALSTTLLAGDYRGFVGADQKGFILAVPSGSGTYPLLSLITNALTYTDETYPWENAPLATATVSGVVKTDVTEGDPMVYTKASVDALLATNSAPSKLDITNGTAFNLTVDGAKPTLYVANVAAMRALTSLTSGQLVQTSGRTIPGYGGATFMWTSGLTTTTNLGTVFDRDSGGTGRFTLAHGDPGDIRLWGAVPGIGDDAPAIQAAIDSLTASTFGGEAKPRIYIPSGQWYVGSTINITNPVTIVGEGVELNSVNVSAYALNGSVFVSTITGGDPVLHVHGQDAGGSDTYIQGIELRDFGIDGSTTDGAGIWFDCNSNASDIYLSRIIVRNVGGSAFKGGDGTKDGSPRYGYSTFEELTAIFPGLDGFEFYCEQLATVKMRFVGLYVNGPGRHSFNFWNMGDFYAERWVENNAGQDQDGNGLNLNNINNATFVNCYWEGDGRTQSAGGSYTPAYSASAAHLAGVLGSTFIDCFLTSPSGNLLSPSTSGVLELVSSVSTNGFPSRDTINNRFINSKFYAYTPSIAAPSGSAVGSGGSLSAGVYRYRVTMTYSGGWETPLANSGERVVTAVSSDSVSLTSIPTGSTLGGQTVSNRKIYRTEAGGSTWKLLTTIADNTTTVYTDTTADASLGATASFFWLIYADSASAFNRFEDVTTSVQPLVSDGGIKNKFNTIYASSTFTPSQMPNIGQGGFNTTYSSGFNGTRHFFGADSAGMYSGWGLTAATAKRSSFVIPSYQSSRFAQNQATMVDGEITSSANVVNIGGGNSSDYAATEIALYAASGQTTTTGTKQVSITSAGTAFQTAIDLNSASTIDVTLTYSSAPVLANNVWLQAKDSGGTSRELIGKSSSDIVRIGSGSGSERINILAGTGGLYLGQPGVTASVYIPRINTADAINTNRNSQSFGYVGSYWNGSAEVQVEAMTRLSMDSTAPTYSLYWGMGGTDRMRLKSDGTLWIGSADQPVVSYSGSPSTGNILVYTNSAWAVMSPGASGIGGSTGSTDNSILRADGTGGSTLQNSAVIIDDYTSSTANNVAIKVDDGSTANISAVITPKGSGSFSLGPKPDGTTTGGNARGQYAVDLSMVHAAANYVASGNYALAGVYGKAPGTASVALGWQAEAAGDYSYSLGRGGFASGAYSAVIGGANAVASAQYAVATGEATANKRGQFGISGGLFGAAGDSQSSIITVRNSTSSTTPTELFTDASSGRLTLANNSAWTFEAKVTGITSGAAAVYSYILTGVITRGANAAATTMPAAVTKTVIYESNAAADVDATADTTNGSLKIAVTAFDSTATRWSATVIWNQIGY